MNIQQNIPLAPYTTFKVGGNARFFVEVTTLEELQNALGYALGRGLPFFILGGGSNMVIGDNGFSGLVIKSAFKGITLDRIGMRGECVAYAGESWDAVVEATVKAGLWGLENLSLIPGTVGGAVVQNIGAYGVELKECIAWVDAFHVLTGTVKRLRALDCDFAYRTSMFKTSKGREYVVIAAAFSLSAISKPRLEYNDVHVFFKNNSAVPSLTDIRKAIIDIRTAKMPNLAEYGTAGSFFKNPIVEKKHYERLVELYSDMPAFIISNERVKIPAAWLIDRVCGLKGDRRGEVGTFEKQALVLVNYGNATATEIALYADMIVAAVQEKTDIVLEREVEYRGL